MPTDFGKAEVGARNGFRGLLGRVPSGAIDGLIILAAVCVVLLGLGCALVWVTRDF